MLKLTNGPWIVVHASNNDPKTAVYSIHEGISFPTAKACEKFIKKTFPVQHAARSSFPMDARKWMKPEYKAGEFSTMEEAEAFANKIAPTTKTKQ